MKKKLKCMVMICATILAGFQAMPITHVIADQQTISDDINCAETVGNFTENLEEYEYIERKVGEEVAQSAFGEEYQEVEKFLNQNGIFDEEIEELNIEEQFEEIEEKGVENVSVQTGYYAVDDTPVEEMENEEEQNQSDKNIAADMIQLEQNEVDKYIADEYYDQDTGIMDEIASKFEENKEPTLKNEIMRAIGLETVEAYATIKIKGGGSKSLLKKTVIVIKENASYAKVNVYFEWTKMPQNRNLDTIGIMIDGAQYPKFESGDTYKGITAKHEYTEIIREGYVGCQGKGNKVKINMTSSTKKLKSNEYYAESGGIEAAIALQEDENWLKSDGNVHDKEVINEKVWFEFYVRLNSPNQSMIVIKPDYIHVKKTKNQYDLLMVAASIASGDYVSAVYYLASGAKTNVTTEHSGDGTVRFEMAVGYK